MPAKQDTLLPDICDGRWLMVDGAGVVAVDTGRTRAWAGLSQRRSASYDDGRSGLLLGRIIRRPRWGRKGSDVARRCGDGRQDGS
jgi:hypothetical protein